MIKSIILQVVGEFAAIAKLGAGIGAGLAAVGEEIFYLIMNLSQKNIDDTDLHGYYKISKNENPRIMALSASFVFKKTYHTNS